MQAAGHLPAGLGLTAPGSRALADASNQSLPDDASLVTDYSPAAAGERPRNTFADMVDADEDARLGRLGPQGGAGGATMITPDGQGGFKHESAGAPEPEERAPRGLRVNAVGGYERIGEGEPSGEKGKPEKGVEDVQVTRRAPAAGGGGGVARAQDVRVGQTIREGASSADLAGLDKAENQARAAGENAALGHAANQAGSASEQAYQLGKQNIEEAAAIRAQERRNVAMRADYEQRQAQIDRERASIDNSQVNPDRLFQNKGNWARALAGVQVLAGGLLMGLQKRGSNPGLDAINGAIDRDVQEQKESLARRRQGLAGRESELERLTKIYGNPAAAEAELRDRKRALIQAYATQSAGNAGAAELPDTLKATFAQWNAEAAEGQAQRKAQLGDQVVSQYKRVSFGGPGKPKKATSAQEHVAGQIGAVDQILRDLHPVPNETSTRLPEEGGLLTRANKAAHEFIGGKGAYEASLPPEENEMRARLQTAKLALKAATANSVDKLRLSDSDRAQLDASVDSAHDAAGLKRAGERVRATLVSKAAGMASVDVAGGGHSSGATSEESEGE